MPNTLKGLHKHPQAEAEKQVPWTLSPTVGPITPSQILSLRL